MRRLLPSSLFFLFSVASLQAQAPVESIVEPILAEAPANAPEIAPVATPTSAGTPGKLSYSSCNVEGQYVAMTFDDGPHAQNTPRLLDILKQRGIKATFFVVGQNAAENPEILKRIVAEGHELANHSYTHPILASLGESGLRDQLEKTHQAVLKATGVTMKIMRPPYGALSEPQRRWTNTNFGYRIILWDVDPLDWKFRDASRVENEILGHVKAGSIVLSHDIHKTTVDAMPSTLDALTAKGFKFVTVSELLAMDRPTAPRVPGTAPKAATKSTVETSSEDAPKKKTVTQQDPKPVERQKNTDTSAISDGAKKESSSKTAGLTQEELRKKWLQSMNQR